MTAVRAGVSEYDRFGPWIDTVQSADDLPRLYRDHPIDFATARLVLKVPRNIARRNATADMDLYDRLLILDATTLTVLTRRVPSAKRGAAALFVRGFDAVTIALADVVAIRDTITLLDGQLVVATRHGEVIAVPYNGSASATVAGLVASLREAAVAREVGATGTTLLAAGEATGTLTDAQLEGSSDVRTVNRFREVRGKNRALIPWTGHAQRRVRPRVDGAGGLLRAAHHTVAPMTLHGALLAADASALEIFARNAWLARGTAPTYSTSRLVLPLGAIDAIAVAQHPVYPAALAVSLRAGEWVTDLAVPADSGAARVFAAASEDAPGA